MKLANMLNLTAACFRTEETNPAVLEYDPYDDLKFSEFGLARDDTRVM